jgi:hypothetical protein
MSYLQVDDYQLQAKFHCTFPSRIAEFFQPEIEIISYSKVNKSIMFLKFHRKRPEMFLRQMKTNHLVVQLLELNAPLRTDEDFLSYCESDESRDNHITNIYDISPFVGLNVPMVTAFPIEPMHTMYACCFGRLIKGIVSVQNSESYRLVFTVLFLNHFLKTTTIRMGGNSRLKK